MISQRPVNVLTREWPCVRVDSRPKRALLPLIRRVQTGPLQAAVVGVRAPRRTTLAVRCRPTVALRSPTKSKFKAKSKVRPKANSKTKVLPKVSHKVNPKASPKSNSKASPKSNSKAMRSSAKVQRDGPQKKSKQRSPVEDKDCTRHKAARAARGERADAAEREARAQAARKRIAARRKRTMESIVKASGKKEEQNRKKKKEAAARRAAEAAKARLRAKIYYMNILKEEIFKREFEAHLRSLEASDHGSTQNDDL